ncbi:MAG TPA: class I SAM-dependent methyltransferase, partial [Gammaproteobacteria bacterium]|nr:class I SAM-dependent methyltransferase [Gammaproteobacteria bacterium]
YERTFFESRTFWTADVSPAARRDGARNHVTAAIQDLDAHFPPGYFDLVLMNGVYGHGLMEYEECERAFGTCYELLRPGGHFMFGWNDVPEHRGAPLDAIEHLARFAPSVCPPLAAHVYATDTASRHIFQFYRRPE